MSYPNFPVDIIKCFRLGFLMKSLAFFMISLILFCQHHR